MRILQVLEPADGGVPRFVRAITSGLTRRGHHVDAIVSSRGPVATELRNAGANATTIDFVPEMIAPVADVRAGRALWKLLRGAKWDVVHTHGNKAGVFARPIAHFMHMPVVHTPHSFAYTTQRIRARRGVEARRIATLLIEKALAPAADIIVTASDDERDVAVRDRVAPAERFVVIRYGLDSEGSATAPADLIELRRRAPLVGFCGRLSQEKGPSLFVETLKTLRARGVAFTAAIVGDGPMGAAVRRDVTESGLADRVHIHAFVDVGTAALAAFDVYVLPSRWESLPIGVLEAMATGLPVVASDVGGVREAVLDGRTGILVPRDDVKATADAVERLLSDGSLRRRMGEAGRAHQRATFGYDRMLDEIEAVYRRVLEPRPERRRARKR